VTRRRLLAAASRRCLALILAPFSFGLVLAVLLSMFGRDFTGETPGARGHHEPPARLADLVGAPCGPGRRPRRIFAEPFHVGPRWCRYM